MGLRSNYVLVGALGILCGVVLSGHLSITSVLATQTEQNTITASKITIVGKDGKPRITLGVEDDGSADVLIYDGNGNRQIGLGTEANDSTPTKGHKRKGGGAAVNLFDPSGKVVRGTFFVRGDGSTGLELTDRYGKPTSGLVVDALGTPGRP